LEDKLGKIHRGALLHSVAKLHKLSINKIATKAGYDQSTFYVHTKKLDLPFETIYRYGQVMDHDFSREIPEMVEFLKDNHLLKSGGKLSYEELEKERDDFMGKYLKTLEDYNTLLKKLNP
jgi:DNA-binding transcriptional ArsR family regulator